MTIFGMRGMEPSRLAAYLARIGLDHAPSADVEGLARVHYAHRLAIPFENLDIPLRRGIDIASDAIAAKLVGQRRGGYCFEHNGLFLEVLTALGFKARPILARVWLGVAPGEVPPLTHMLLLVTLDGREWIADVGFGGSFTPPLPLEDGAEAQTFDGARHRLRRAATPGDPNGEWLLERDGTSEATDGRSTGRGWQPQYGFAACDVAAADIAQGNHWTATRPGTRFTTLCVASLILPGGFAALTDCRLSVYRGGEAITRLIEGPEDYRKTLDEMFRIDLTPEEVCALPMFACVT